MKNIIVSGLGYLTVARWHRLSQRLQAGEPRGPSTQRPAHRQARRPAAPLSPLAGRQPEAPQALPSERSVARPLENKNVYDRHDGESGRAPLGSVEIARWPWGSQRNRATAKPSVPMVRSADRISCPAGGTGCCAASSPLTSVSASCPRSPRP